MSQGLNPKAWAPQEGREERREKKVAKLSQKKKKAEKRRLYKERKQGGPMSSRVFS